MIEIERKFLVSSTEFFALADSKVYIKQGYLSKDPHRTVRVRIKDERAFLTIKGISSESGMSRFEWEKEIALEEGETLMRLCLPTIIEKTRFIVPQGTLTFEVDVFEREHKGLILAEIELPSEKTTINLPPWIGKEVTGDKRYYNSYLSSKESKNSL
ncbi:MAG: CYTH domain-containing protein [Flavobacteriaceae bacterium]|jgi:adenylate cyclase|nr:CYTH domain-containing protein [Flavobacteriaceae bacterium]